MCGERSGTIWLPSHHPGGCCTLVVDEEISPLLCKAFECLEKRYININNYSLFINLLLLDPTKQKAINLESFLKFSSSSEVHILVIQYFANTTEKSLCIQTPRSYNSQSIRLTNATCCVCMQYKLDCHWTDCESDFLGYLGLNALLKLTMVGHTLMGSKQQPSGYQPGALNTTPHNDHQKDLNQHPTNTISRLASK